ncbi:MAG: ankyrin repeat domain-containing protein [Candidatus Berkiella sp.]
MIINEQIGELMEAIANGDESAQDKLLELVAQMTSAATADNSELSALDKALFEAASDGDADKCSELIQQGANPSFQKGDGTRPIDFAASKGHTQVCRVLITAGVDPNVINMGQTVLHTAAAYGHTETCIALIEAGCDVNLVSFGFTPLALAISNGHLETAAELFKHQSTDLENFNIHMQLVSAVDSDRVDMAKLLIAHGAKPNLAPQALYRAVQNNQNKMCKVLLTHGADPNTTDDEPVLHVAVYNANKAICKMLLNSGADVNMTDQTFNDTALSKAAGNGHFEICTTLVMYGADHTIKNHFGDVVEQVKLTKGEEGGYAISQAIAEGLAARKNMQARHEELSRGYLFSKAATVLRALSEIKVTVQENDAEGKFFADVMSFAAAHPEFGAHVFAELGDTVPDKSTKIVGSSSETNHDRKAAKLTAFRAHARKQVETPKETVTKAVTCASSRF